MSNESNGAGSDLDIFEGLGKKASERLPAAPPPPPGSSSMPSARPAADAKRTLLGVAVPAAPPPPPGASTPPSLGAAPPPPPPVSAAPPPPPVSAAPPPPPVSAAPPPPPVSAAPPPPPVSVAPPLPAPPVQSSRPVPEPAVTSPMPLSRPTPVPPPARPASVPPPPPGRGSLPNFVPPRTSVLPAEGATPASTRPTSSTGAPARVSVPPPVSTRPGMGVVNGTRASAPSPAPAPEAAQPTALAKNSAKLDMDWDDDQEATQVFDKEASKVVDPDASAQSLIAPAASEPERASMDLIMAAAPTASVSPSTAPASALPTAVAPPITAGINATAPMSAVPAPLAPPPATATLSGAFAALGASGTPSQRVTAPPGTQPVRSTPPAPPNSMRPGVTPPPPPGQVTTAPMHMPLQPPPAHGDTMQSMQSPLAAAAAHTSAPPPAMHTSAPPPAIAPSAPPVQLPPVSRAMDATHMVPRARANRTPLIVGIIAGALVLGGIGTFVLMPRTGTLVVNVADTKGGVVPNLEVSVDGTKRCDSAPCIVHDVASGVHQVKVSAKGFDQPAPRAITIESGRDQTADFQLNGSKTSSGTGFKVAASHPGVKLAVDGKDVGLLPQELSNLQPGEHTLKLYGDRYATLEKTISVAKDEIVDLGTVNLKVSKGKATIAAGTPGAKVYIVNGSERKEVPQLPVAIEFGINEHWELHGTKDGYEDYREAISFDDGQAEKTFTVTLSPKGTAAAARPTTPAPAFTPAAPKEPAAPVAKASPPAAPAEAPKEKKEAPAAAAAGEAVLKINSLPSSAIVLDGKPIGTTPQLHVVVSPGTHTVMFVNTEQSLKKTISVDVKAGETKAAFAKLRD